MKRREFRTIATPAAPACDVEGVPRSVRVVVEGDDPGYQPPSGISFERPQSREERLAPGRATGGDIGVDFEIADNRVWPVLQDEAEPFTAAEVGRTFGLPLRLRPRMGGTRI